jgi:ATP-dependent RNA helicase DeaD
MGDAPKLPALRRDLRERRPRGEPLPPRPPRREPLADAPFGAPQALREASLAHVPVSAAGGTFPAPAEAGAGPRETPHRHADFSTWQPPEEEGDDEPILAAQTEGAAARPRGRESHALREAALASQALREAPLASQALREAPLGSPAFAPSAAPADGDFAEIYINVGRRDGARAADFQSLLTERAGLDRADVRRIRVRERNAFVSVRREDLPRALAALNGATIAGKPALAEQARERGEGEAAGAPAAPSGAASAVDENEDDPVPTGRSGVGG